jgi:hypothetical protein
MYRYIFRPSVGVYVDIYRLKNSDRELILNSRRTTGLIGFLVNMMSIQGILNDQILKENNHV